MESELDALNTEVAAILDTVPADGRKLVTGHESLGYLAERYGYELIGAVIPAITTQAEASAGELADLSKKITAAGVPAIFTELGTPAATVEALGADTGVKVVELSTHTLPEDGSYATFMTDIANTIAGRRCAQPSERLPATHSREAEPVTWWVAPFTDNPFLMRALLAGVLVAVSCAIAGTFVVLRGLAFLGDALAHGVLPGVAGALLLGLPGLLGAAVGATLMIGA